MGKKSCKSTDKYSRQKRWRKPTEWLTTSWSPITGVSSLPSGLGALGSTWGAATHNPLLNYHTAGSHSTNYRLQQQHTTLCSITTLLDHTAHTTGSCSNTQPFVQLPHCWITQHKLQAPTLCSITKLLDHTAHTTASCSNTQPFDQIPHCWITQHTLLAPVATHNPLFN